MTGLTLEVLEARVRTSHLQVLGAFHPTPEDKAPQECATMLLLGPDEPAFWPAFTASPEMRDGAPDPMDRWSRRVIDKLAEEADAQALYPFGGAPFLPFFSWATRTNRIHASPIMLLVHDRAGLFVSFRGALALRERINLPATPPSPCDSCTDQPCRTACPVAAFAEGSYDVPRCKGFLESEAGADCMQQGCAARRACPVSQNYPRLARQSAWHMKKFKG